MEFSEVIKRRRMVRAFTGEPLAAGVSERLLRPANRARTRSVGPCPFPGAAA